MEMRVVWAIPLHIIYDDILKIGYVKILGKEKLESIKLPTNPSNYKYTHLLSASYLLELELVKTKRNWILKNILHYHSISNLKTYKDFLKQSEFVQTTLKFIHEEQELHILDFLMEKLSPEVLPNLTPTQFEMDLLEQLGFSRQNQSLQSSKSQSGL